LLDSLKKAPAERALNAETDYLQSSDERASNSRNGYGRGSLQIRKRLENAAT